MRFNRKTILSVVSCILLVCTLFSCLTFNATSATLDELQTQLNQLEKEQAQISSKINSIKNDKNKQIEYKNALLSQINNTRAQIDAYTNSIALVDGKISDTDTRIAAKDKELAQLKNEFKARIRSICMNGGDSTNALLSVLLSAEDFADILTVAEYTKNLASYDAKVMEDIAAAVKAIQSEQANLQSERNTLATYQAKLASKKSDLDSQLATANQLIVSLGQQESQLNSDYADLEREAKKVEEAIRLASINQNNGTFDGSFYWPLPGKKADYRLTSPIQAARPHPVYGTIRAHTGNDYAKAGINGLPIYAAASGTVSIATYNAGGFGYYVMINHGAINGSTYSTLYAHMTRYVVSKGQTVKKGDVIGYVGSSGAATGPHLHLEVRINGSPVNPDPYFN
ncbi:MAG: peptidoglycan DD-metalloendopeptidase family protein [Clostridia bacterium]|nr:peptidoglycan DD-metalloendopeptidase family protein [Clostridia bacterium]